MGFYYPPFIFTEEKQGFTWSDTNEDETLFRGYINNRLEAEIILKAIRMDSNPEGIMFLMPII